ncbi:hypothetical protein FAGAP_126 [Fusarium agapanthi]|uniref:Uncharacterized protein n=1 Tax=Fusarium agapanthi TaxID=1803897 RepID=A0A9P5BKI4_9HYPO|nr:hypothetical protein FAGAP_126 [Fusarium agapanthi]
MASVGGSQPSPPSARQSLIHTQPSPVFLSAPINFSLYFFSLVAFGVTTQTLSVTDDTIMSSAPPRIEDTEHPSKRHRVDEDVPPENKDSVRITILKDENKALADEVSRLKQALEEAQNAASAANEAKDALKAENDELKKAQEQAREDMRRDEMR